MFKAITVTLLTLSTTIAASAAPKINRPALDLSMGYQKVSETQATAFEKDLKINGIKCATVVSIATGGIMGSATASVCTINDSVVYACRNDMTGAVSSSSEAPVNFRVSTGLNLTAFILQNCIGG